MNEQDLQKMFDFFVSEGYDMKDFNTFKSSMQSDAKRKKMHSFFSGEGYDMGEYDKFVFAPKIEPVTPLKTDPIDTALTQLADTVRTYDEGLAKTLEANRPVVREMQTKKKTEQDQRKLFEGIPGLEHLAQEQNYGFNPAVNSFLETQYKEATPELKNNLAQHLLSMPESRFKETMSGRPNERQKARLLSEATQAKAQRVATDFEIAKSQAKDLEKYGTLVGTKEYLEGLEQTEEVKQAQERVNKELEAFKSSPEEQLVQLQDQYEKEKQTLSSIYKLYPDEALRLQKVKEKRAAVTINPTDSTLTKVKKNVKASLGEIPNAVIRGAVNLLEESKQLADISLEAAGFDTDYETRSDRALTAVSDFAEDFTQSVFPTLENAQVFKDGDIQSEAVMPAITRTLADMGVLMFGAKGMGGGGAGLVLSGLAQTAPDFYYAAKEQGLNNKQALVYAQSQAFAQGLLELLNPGSAGKLIAGTPGRGIADLVKLAKGRKLTAGDITSFVMSEVAGENAQEFAQLLTEKAGQLVSDQAIGTEFKPKITLDETYETLFLTSIVSGLSGGAGVKAAQKARRKEAITQLSELENVPELLNDQVKQGNIDIADAQQILEEVEVEREARNIPEAILENDNLTEDITSLEQATEELNNAINEKKDIPKRVEAIAPEPDKANTEGLTKKNKKKLEVGDLVEYEGLVYEVQRKKPNGSYDLIEPGQKQGGAKGVFPDEITNAYERETESEAKVEPTTETQTEAEAEVQNLSSRERVAVGLKESFGLDQKKTDATMSIYDAVAESWAKRNNKTAEDWYARIEVKKGTPEDEKALREGAAKFQEPYKSNIRTSLDQTKLKKATPKEWMNEFQKSKGTKQEIDAIGLEEYMQDYMEVTNSKSVPKDEIEKYITLNEIPLKEIVLGEPLAEVPITVGLDALDRFKRTGKPQKIEGTPFEITTVNNAVVRNTDVNPEKVYLLQETDERGRVERDYYLKLDNPEDLATVLSQFNYYNTRNPEYKKWKESGGEDYREMLITMPEGESFRAGHFPNTRPENVIAHTRFDTRTNDKGEKILFVEEVQSDWSQKLRDEGERITRDEYEKRTDELKEEERLLNLRANGILDRADKVYQKEVETTKNPLFLEGALSDYFGIYHKSDRETISENREDYPKTYALVQEYEDIRKKKDEIQLRISDLTQKLFAPPGMPWSKTEQWVGLVARRLIQYAAQNGFDRIAWTTGKQQNERYNLNQVIDTISYIRNDDKTYNITLYKNGEVLDDLIEPEEPLSRRRLVETLGENIVRKIDEGEKSGVLEENDLEVGGEGMRSFYDKILPNIFKNEAKRYDKDITVENTRIDLGALPEVVSPSLVDITKEAYELGYPVKPIEDLLEDLLRDLKPESDLYKKALVARAGSRLRLKIKSDRIKGKTKEAIIEELKSQNERDVSRNRRRIFDNIQLNNQIIEALEADLITVKYGLNEQQSIPVTDKLKQVTEVPMFQGAKAALQTKGGKHIIWALTDPDVSSPVHELAHIFETELTEPQRKAVLEWTGDKTWTRDTSEKFARGFEKYLSEGKAPNSKLKKVFEQFKNWLKDIYKGLIKYGDEEIVLNDKMRALYDEILTAEDYIEHMNELEEEVKFQETQPTFFEALTKFANKLKQVKPNTTFEQFKKEVEKRVKTKVSDETLTKAWAGEKLESKVKKKEKELGEQQTDVKKGKFAKRVTEDSRVLDEVKEQIKENSLDYFSQPNRVTDAAAEYALNQFESNEAAADALMSADRLDGAVRAMLGQKLVIRLSNDAKNNPDNAKKYLDKAIDVADFVVEFGREAGRTVQAFRAWSAMTPEGILLFAHRSQKKSKDSLLSAHRKDIDLAVEAFQRAEEQARQDTLKIPPPKEITLFGFTKQELKEKKLAAWNKFKKFTGLSVAAAGLTKEQIEAISEYGFYSFIDGLRTFKEWSAHIKTKFKLKGQQAKDATTHIWNNEATPFGKTLMDLSATTINNLSPFLGTKNLAEEIKNEFHVSDKEAQNFADQLNRVYEQKIKQKAKSQSRAVISRKGIYGKVGNAISKAVEKNVLTKAEIEKNILDSYGFSNLTQQDLDFLEAKAKEMAALPEGTLKDKRAWEIMQYLKDKQGETTWSDTFISLWYAAILSGPATQIVNIVSTGFNLGFETIITSLEKAAQGDVRGLKNTWTGLARGMRQGWTEAAIILTEGQPPNKRSSKFFEAGPLEQFEVNWKKDGPGKAMLKIIPTMAKYVPRFMSATDTFFYYMAFESAAGAYANSMVNRKIGLTDQERQDLYNELVGLPFGQALQQAKAELTASAAALGVPVSSIVTKREIKRRAWEIIEQSRSAKDAHLMDLADRYASFGTYNYKPQGLLGMIAGNISEASNKFPPIKLLVPFTNIVANVLNQQLDYTPLGLVRWSKSAFNVKLFNKLEPFATGDRQLDDRMLIKGLFGTTGLAALLLFFLKDVDDEEEAAFPEYTISGSGPRGAPDSYAKKAQLYERGWKPYSIKVGNNWYSYQYIPLAAVLTIFGNIHDAKKYDKVKDEKLLPSLWAGMLEIAPAILHMSFLQGLAEFFEAMSSEKSMSSWISRFSSRTATSVFPNLLKSIDAAFDPTIYEAKTFGEKIVKGTPFVKGGLRPSLNSFGEPITKKPIGGTTGVALGLDRFTSIHKYDDPIVGLFAEKGEFAPVIGRAIKWQGVGFDDNQYYDFCEIVGKIFKKELADNLTFYKELDGEDNLIWSGKPYSEFGKAAKQLHNDIRDSVKQQMMGEGMSKKEILAEYGLK